jgi:hypothetical protein
MSEGGPWERRSCSGSLLGGPADGSLPSKQEEVVAAEFAPVVNSGRKFPIVPLKIPPPKDDAQARPTGGVWLGEVSEAPFLSYQLDSVERPGAVKGALVLRGKADP